MEIPSGTVRRQLSYNLLILNANNINTRITLSWTKISFSIKRKYLIEAMSLSQHTQTWLKSGLNGQRSKHSRTKIRIYGQEFRFGISESGLKTWIQWFMSLSPWTSKVLVYVLVLIRNESFRTPIVPRQGTGDYIFYFEFDRYNKMKNSDMQHTNSAVISLDMSPRSPIVIKLITRVTWLLGYSWSFCLDSFRELEIELTICT